MLEVRVRLTGGSSKGFFCWCCCCCAVVCVVSPYLLTWRKKLFLHCVYLTEPTFHTPRLSVRRRPSVLLPKVFFVVVVLPSLSRSTDVIISLTIVKQHITARNMSLMVVCGLLVDACFKSGTEFLPHWSIWQEFRFCLIWLKRHLLYCTKGSRSKRWQIYIQKDSFIWLKTWAFLSYVTLIVP